MYDESGYNMLIHARLFALCCTNIVFFTCLEPLWALQLRIWIIHVSKDEAGEFNNSATDLSKEEKLCNSLLGKVARHGDSQLLGSCIGALLLLCFPFAFMLDDKWVFLKLCLMEIINI